jgi:hypothetical protein
MGVVRLSKLFCDGTNCSNTFPEQKDHYFHGRYLVKAAQAVGWRFKRFTGTSVLVLCSQCIFDLKHRPGFKEDLIQDNQALPDPDLEEGIVHVPRIL